jgi:hypothetical protein
MSYRQTDLLKTFRTEGRQKTSTRIHARNCKKTPANIELLDAWARNHTFATTTSGLIH